MSSPADNDATRRAGAILTIDLGAIAANWRGLRDAGRAAGRPVDCAAVLKADAYGTGAAMVGPRLPPKAAGTSSSPISTKASRCAPCCPSHRSTC